MRVGVEVGGTFTDLVAVEGGRVVVTKVPSTPRSPDIGAFAALLVLLCANELLCGRLTFSRAGAA